MSPCSMHPFLKERRQSRGAGILVKGDGYNSGNVLKDAAKEESCGCQNTRLCSGEPSFSRSHRVPLLIQGEERRGRVEMEREREGEDVR